MAAHPNPPPEPTKPLMPHFGTEVTGERHYARQALREEFDSVMTGTNGATLFGLRRIGKSSEAAACAERLQAATPPWLVLRQDAQGMRSEAELLVQVLKHLPNTGWLARITKVVADDNAISATARDAIAKLSGGGSADVQAYFSPIAAAIERTVEQTDRVVLMIDEFPWLCRNILEADATGGRGRVDVLLASLRRWRNKGVRMLLMGSIGMAGLGRQHHLDLSHLSDLTPLEVPPLNAEEARDMVRRLAAGSGVQGWSEAHTDMLITESSALFTSMIQRAFQQLTVGGRAVAPGDMADVFADKIRPNLDAAFYQQFDRRLHLYRELAPPLPTLLQASLERVLSAPAPLGHRELAAAAGPAVTAADLGDALTMLREDGFLSMRAPRGADQIWRSASSLVDAWWAQRRKGTSK